MKNKEIRVCGGYGCSSSKSMELAENLRVYAETKYPDAGIEIKPVGCFGFCEQGPIVKSVSDDVFYTKVQPNDYKRIINEHIIGGVPVDDLLYKDREGNKYVTDKDIPFNRGQVKIALRNCGVVNPRNIYDYLEEMGYEALAKAITMMTPESVIKEVKDSGLRGRGGGGFSTGLKWEFAAREQSDIKYVVCNADEGDPGAFMDRSIIESDPHSVIEAMAICGYAIGSNTGVVYIRAEYPTARRNLRHAINQAREEGFLGTNIMGTGFDFDIEIKLGAGAFVCGEETALIHSLEGKRGEPTTKPPFPAVSGYWGKPTNVNNVETYANIPVIILKGADWYNQIGTERSKGTKVFALAGKINNVGLIEVPMGTTLREVIYEIGGGIKDGKKFKAIQTGGPSGGCLTEDDLDTPIDFDTLTEKGSMMGSGGMIVMDEDDCMVSVAKFFLEFTEEESCGKCTPCRIGTKRLKELLDIITTGEGTMAHLDELRRLSTVIKDTSLCGLGQSAPNPVLSTLDKFWDEYVAHVKKKQCPAHSCTDLIQYLIDPNLCVGCTSCVKVCPTDSISGSLRKIHQIDQNTCIRCGACVDACRPSAIVVR